MINQAIITAGGVFLATTVLFPLDRRYKAWKASRPEVILRRNWRGRLVPDLRIKRIERTALIAVGLFFVFGLWVSWVIMTKPQPTDQQGRPIIQIPNQPRTSAAGG